MRAFWVVCKYFFAQRAHFRSLSLRSNVLRNLHCVVLFTHYRYFRFRCVPLVSLRYVICAPSCEFCYVALFPGQMLQRNYHTHATQRPGNNATQRPYACNELIKRKTNNAANIMQRNEIYESNTWRNDAFALRRVINSLRTSVCKSALCARSARKFWF